MLNRIASHRSGHCKTLAPKYEQLAQVFAGEAGVVIANVDATVSPELATRYDVTGYPTLKVFPQKTTEPVNYEGARELPELVAYMNEIAGTQRLADGSLAVTAGLVEVLNEVIQQAPALDEAFLAAMTAAAADLDQATVKYYVSFAAKVVAQGQAYVQKELARLHGFVQSKSVSAEKKKGFSIRYNILRMFQK